MINGIQGRGAKELHSRILVSVRCLLDLDYGLVKYIAQELPNNKIFNLDKFYDVAFYNLIDELYTREYDNPLYYLAYPGVDRKMLDDLRKEIMEERENKVLEYCISTEMANVMEIWFSDREIGNVSIYCYTETEKEVLSTDPTFSKYDIITTPEEALKNCEQFFFLSIDEIGPFTESQLNTFYFSKRRLNFIIEPDGQFNIDPKNEDIKKLILNKNEISIFDLYREEILRRDEEDDEDSDE